MPSNLNSIVKIETENSNKIFIKFFIMVNLIFLVISVLFYYVGNELHYYHIQYHLLVLIVFLIPLAILLTRVDSPQLFKYIFFFLYIFYIFSIILINGFDVFYLIILLSINFFGIIYMSKKLYIVSTVIAVLTTATYSYFFDFYKTDIYTILVTIYRTLIVLLVSIGGYLGLLRLLRLLNDVLVDEASPFIDKLTGVFNKHYLKEKISNVKLGKNQLSIIALDIDDMKNINLQYGYRAGDMVLQHFTNILSRIIRNTDSICRTEGDEFIIIIQHPKEFKPEFLAERIKNALEKERINIIDKNGNEVKISITSSFGVVSLREGENSDELLKRAKIVLNKAKENGKNLIEKDY